MPQYEFTEQYERSDKDFYIDPPWASELLFQKVHFIGTIHDPACGSGNIVRVAIEKYGCKNVTSSDITFRDYKPTWYLNYLVDFNQRDNIITNPPYKLVEEFCQHALKHTRFTVAILARLAFLEGQGRYRRLFSIRPPSLVLVFSRRPSMPPPGVPVGGGKTAYCWLVWDQQAISEPTKLDWLL